MVAWAAESLNNVSVYIYDATRMVLPLVGDDGSGARHDWHNILGRPGLLEHTDTIAYTVRGLSGLLFGIALGLAFWWWVRAKRAGVPRDPGAKGSGLLLTRCVSGQRAFVVPSTGRPIQRPRRLRKRGTRS